MKKRIISLAAVIALVLTFFSFTSFAAASGTGYYKTTSAVNLRNGAGTSYAKITTVPKGVTVNVTKISGVWGYTSYAGNSGWISLDYASKTSGPADYSKVDVLAGLDKLRQKFPDGMYWNHIGGKNNPDGWTKYPCTCHPNNCKSVADACDCNVFGGTLKCHGFALKLGYDLFGSMPNTWEVRYTLDDICVGDIIRYRNNEHTVMVTDIGENYLVVVDGNWDYHCGIDWDRPMALSKFANINYIYHAPGNTCKGNNDFSAPELTLSASVDNFGFINASYSAKDNTKLQNVEMTVTAPDGREIYVGGIDHGYEKLSVSGTASIDLYDFGYKKGTYTVTLQAYDWFDNHSQKSVKLTLDKVFTFSAVSYGYTVNLSGTSGTQGLDYYVYTDIHNNRTYDYKLCASANKLELTNEKYYLKISRDGYTSYIDSSFYGGTDTLPATITLYAGDVNDDNVINAKDISALLSYFGNTQSYAASSADFNDDGYVNAKDMAALLINFGKKGTSL